MRFRYGLRKLEFFFAFLIAVMAFTFGYNYFYDLPDQVEMLKGIFIPWCTDCGSDEWMQVGVKQNIMNKLVLIE